MKKALIFGLLLTTLWSCESRVYMKLTCRDAATKEPLSGVKIDVGAGFDGDYTKNSATGETDSAGYFETDMMIGCPGKCYDIYITYTKSGYKTKKELNITEGEILLEKETN
jgi:hypothetical protein